MTKVAALAPQLIASLAMTAAATGIDAYGRRQVRKDQDAANTAWLDYQRRNKARFEGLDESSRAEADRLEGIYGANELDALAQDTLLSGQDPGRSDVFDTAMAKSLADATAEARKRIQGLAKASAYGGGTQFGQGQVLGEAFQDAGTSIGFTNNERRGNTGTLQRYQTVQPEVFEYEQSPLVPILQAGSMIVGGMGPDQWGKMFGGGGLAPTSSIRPLPRPAGLGVRPPVKPVGSFSFMPTYYPQGPQI